MTDQNPLPPHPNPPPGRWFPGGLLVLLGAQLTLLWVQGLQLNRQHHDLAGIRDDLQTLAESLDQNSNGGQEREGYSPARAHRPKHSVYLRVNRQEEKQEPKPEGETAGKEGLKDIEAAKESAQKAVRDARKIQSQLSLSENARIAEEKAKIKEAHAAWEMWALVAGAVVIGALILRGWLRAREE